MNREGKVQNLQVKLFHRIRFFSIFLHKFLFTTEADCETVFVFALFISFHFVLFPLLYTGALSVLSDFHQSAYLRQRS